MVGLSQNIRVEETSLSVYPNPTIENATISFHLDGQQHCLIEAYTITGSKIETIADQFFMGGEHHLSWRTGHLYEGLYFLRLTSGGKSTTAKVIHQR